MTEEFKNVLGLKSEELIKYALTEASIKLTEALRYLNDAFLYNTGNDMNEDLSIFLNGIIYSVKRDKYNIKLAIDNRLDEIENNL